MQCPNELHLNCQTVRKCHKCQNFGFSSRSLSSGHSLNADDTQTQSRHVSRQIKKSVCCALPMDCSSEWNFLFAIKTIVAHFLCIFLSTCAEFCIKRYRRLPTGRTVLHVLHVLHTNWTGHHKSHALVLD